MRRVLSAASLLFALSAHEVVALGQASSGDVALAESLFQEAQKLMHEKHYGQACPKFQESQRLDPGGGTLFQLATCHTLTGKTASAWAEFVEVALLAKQRNRPDIEQAANERVRSLEPRLSRLVIVVPDDARLSGLSLQRDGSVLGAVAYGTAMPADPGEHTIRAEAPGHNAWSITVVLGDNADKKTVTIPPLEKSPERVPDAKLVAPLLAGEPPHSRRSSALFYGAAGVGVVGVGVATYFGIQSYTKEREARTTCPNTACSDSAAVEKSKAGLSAAYIADVGAAAGIVGLGVATYLLVTGAGPGTTTKASLHLSPQARPHGVAIGVDGSF